MEEIKAFLMENVETLTIKNVDDIKFENNNLKIDDNFNSLFDVLSKYQINYPEASNNIIPYDENNVLSDNQSDGEHAVDFLVNGVMNFATILGIISAISTSSGVGAPIGIVTGLVSFGISGIAELVEVHGENEKNLEELHQYFEQRMESEFNSFSYNSIEIVKNALNSSNLLDMLPVFENDLNMLAMLAPELYGIWNLKDNSNFAKDYVKKTAESNYKVNMLELENIVHDYKNVNNREQIKEVEKNINDSQKVKEIYRESYLTINKIKTGAIGEKEGIQKLKDIEFFEYFGDIKEEEFHKGFFEFRPDYNKKIEGILERVQLKNEDAYNNAPEYQRQLDELQIAPMKAFIAQEKIMTNKIIYDDTYTYEQFANDFKSYETMGYSTSISTFNYKDKASEENFLAMKERIKEEYEANQSSSNNYFSYSPASSIFTSSYDTDSTDKSYEYETNYGVVSNESTASFYSAFNELYEYFLGSAEKEAGFNISRIDEVERVITVAGLDEGLTGSLTSGIGDSLEEIINRNSLNGEEITNLITENHNSLYEKFDEQFMFENAALTAILGVNPNDISIPYLSDIDNKYFSQIEENMTAPGVTRGFSEYIEKLIPQGDNSQGESVVSTVENIKGYNFRIDNTDISAYYGSAWEVHNSSTDNLHNRDEYLIYNTAAGNVRYVDNKLYNSSSLYNSENKYDGYNAYYKNIYLGDTENAVVNSAYNSSSLYNSENRYDGYNAYYKNIYLGDNKNVVVNSAYNSRSLYSSENRYDGHNAYYNSMNLGDITNAVVNSADNSSRFDNLLYNSSSLYNSESKYNKYNAYYNSMNLGDITNAVVNSADNSSRLHNLLYNSSSLYNSESKYNEYNAHNPLFNPKTEIFYPRVNTTTESLFSLGSPKGVAGTSDNIPQMFMILERNIMEKMDEYSQRSGRTLSSLLGLTLGIESDMKDLKKNTAYFDGNKLYDNFVEKLDWDIRSQLNGIMF